MLTPLICTSINCYCFGIFVDFVAARLQVTVSYIYSQSLATQDGL